MRPEEDEADVTEIDGPPRSYFEIPVLTTDMGGLPKAPGEVAFILRIQYKSFLWFGPTQESVEDWRDSVLTQVRRELMRMGGGILWWRTRPQVVPEETGTRWKMRFRLDTSPPLGDAYWRALHTSIGNSATDGWSIGG